MSHPAKQTKTAAPGTISDLLRIQSAADAFDPDDYGAVHDLVRVLDKTSTLLAADQRARYVLLPILSMAHDHSCPPSMDIGNATNPSIWPVLARLWSQTLQAHMLPEPVPEQAAAFRLLCTSIAKFTRNLVAAVPQNQHRALFVHLLLGVPMNEPNQCHNIRLTVRMNYSYADSFTTTHPTPLHRTQLVRTDSSHPSVLG